MKKKNEDNRSNEYWLDDILDQPENKHVQPDGSILYGYDGEPKFGAQGYWLNIKNGLAHVWQAKNPFNENRKVIKACLPLTHPDMYKFFFPFSYIGHFLRNVFSGNIELRRQTLEDSVLVTLIVEMLVLLVLALIVIGIYLLWANVISPIFQ